MQESISSRITILCKIYFKFFCVEYSSHFLKSLITLGCIYTGIIFGKIILNLFIMATQNENLKKALKSKEVTDSPEDQKKLQPDQANIKIPDVSDIPGQEHVHVPRMNELADTTISSDDEEGKGLFDNTEGMEDDANVTDEEKELLEESSISMASDDDTRLRRADLDNKDLDGEPLNEAEDVSGKDLDVPGQEDDDPMEEIGEEDEENNEYSLGGDNHDNVPNV